MSGFGIRSLRKEVAAQVSSNNISYYKTIIVGENPFGFFTFDKLRKDQESILFLTQNIYGKDQIERDLACTINAIRSEEVADELSFSQMEVFDETKEVVFYKDTKFHRFGARAKSHPLAEGEDFFTNSFRPVKTSVEFDEVDLAKFQKQKIIRKIVLVEPTDLVEPTRFELHTGEGEVFKCENLFYCESPKSFYKAVENKEKLDAKLQQYLVGLEQHPGVTVHFECEGKFTDHFGTMIIPQSLTHDWGSFVLDIEPFDGKNQNFTALTFVNEDDLQEEDLAKKIRLMRKVLERVLPDLATCSYKTTIKYDPSLRYEGINDELATSLAQEAVRLVGPGAPVSHPKSSLFQYFARGTMSLSQL